MNTEALKELIADTLKALCVSASAMSVSDGPRTVVTISSDDAEALIGEKGETLRALNSVVRKMAEKKFGAEMSNFLIDINGYHEAQLEELRGKAKLLASRVRLFKEEAAMDPLNSYERLVIHELFADDPEIATESRGEGKTRHIVIKHKS